MYHSFLIHSSADGHLGWASRVWRKGNPLTLLVGMQTSIATMENSVEISLKLEIELPYDPAIPLLCIHTKETRSERDTCTPMFITALFIKLEDYKRDFKDSILFETSAPSLLHVNLRKTLGCYSDLGSSPTQGQALGPNSCI